jgi:hypothetical protein
MGTQQHMVWVWKAVVLVLAAGSLATGGPAGIALADETDGADRAPRCERVGAIADRVRVAVHGNLERPRTVVNQAIPRINSRLGEASFEALVSMAGKQLSRDVTEDLKQLQEQLQRLKDRRSSQPCDGCDP